MSVNARVEARPVPADASREQKDRAFKSMLAAFKRRVNEAGILIEFNRRQSYESKGQKCRRKMKESILRRKKEELELQNKLRDRFGSNNKKPLKRKFGPKKDFEQYSGDEE
jgi:ribosomal protein S21